ncbi:DUF947-domain-containing protein [Ramicandelaber brevisporus]|nr:DUF947-domain-containing protein [Ramicandelaber brevisporus]KAI8867010.1 DUF947-domain-containing protein [Ramicandelaber brevisporus]
MSTGESDNDEDQGDFDSEADDYDSNEYTDDEYGSEADEEMDEEQRQRIKKELQAQLADASFEELVGIKEKLRQMEQSESSSNQRNKPNKSSSTSAPGRGKSAGSDNDDSGNSGSDDDDDGEDGDAKGSLRRRNSRAPSVMSSKKPVSRYRHVVNAPPPSSKLRDPRFDTLSGRFNEDMFGKSYSFVNDLQTSEIASLKKRLSKTKNQSEREKISKLVTSMESKRAAKERDEKLQSKIREHRKGEMERVKQGKKPYFLKNSDVKKLELIDKFEKLQKKSSNTNKSADQILEKALEKKRKHNATKDRKGLPFKKRRSDD